MHVSVIIPAHNAAGTLEETLESLRAQTHADWEAIIIDDGSTDATVTIAERFVERDGRFRVMSQANGGVSAARNAGISLARYDWLLFLDADDWILPRYLERMAHMLRADDSLDAVYCGWWCVTPDGHNVFKELAYETGDLFALHAVACPFPIHACVVRKSLVKAVGCFDPELHTSEDWDLWQRVARAGARFGAVREALAFYRMRADSATKDPPRIMADGLRVLQQGYAPDPRVPRPHPVYPNGLPKGKKHLLMQKYYLLFYAAGLAIGRGEDATLLLDALGDASCTPLDPYSVANGIVHTAMISACRPLREWGAAWQQVEPRATAFLNALEVYSSVSHLARRTSVICRLLISKYMARVSLLHRVRALPPRILLKAPRLGRDLRRAARSLLQRFAQLAKNSVRITPVLHRRVRALRRRCGPAQNGRPFFGNLLAEKRDPLDYTGTYEQTKYEQMLALIPDGPIEEALELGCGEGHFTMRVAPRVGHLLAADFSQIALARAAERCKVCENVRFQRLDVVTDPIPGRFDLIVCSEVVYHAGGRKQLRAVAGELAKALKPGGTLVMAHPNLIVDEPDHPDFKWRFPIGARAAEETFAEIASFALVKELRTPLYRVQVFRHKETEGLAAIAHAPEIIEMKRPTPLSPDVAARVLWNGGTDRFPILMYHRVAPTGSEALARWRVTTKAFEEQLRYLRDTGFQSVGLEDWYAWIYGGWPLPRGAVLITFDDGYRDFMKYAWPLLQYYGLSATVYLVAGEIGHANRWEKEYDEAIPLLEWREIRQLQAEGVRFGSHSVSHPKLTSIPLKQVVHELRHSKEILEQGLGVSVKSFSYPYDYFNKVVQYLTGICGYDFALSCKPGLCTVRDSLLALPRIEVEGSDTLETFAAKLESLVPVDKQIAVDGPIRVPAYTAR